MSSSAALPHVLNPGTVVRDRPLAPFVAASLAGLAWCVPNHQLPWSSFHSDLVMAVAFALAGVWGYWRTRHDEARVPAIAVVAAATILIPLSQLLLGKLLFAGDFWLVALYLAGFALAVAMGYRLALLEGASALFGVCAWTVLLSAIVSVGLALYQWQRLDYLGAFVSPMPQLARAIANLNQPNHLATLLVMALCSVAWLHERGRIGPFIALLLVGHVGLGLAMTQSRVGFLSVTAVAGWLLWKRGGLGTALSRRRVLIAWAVVVGCALVWPLLTRVTDAPAGRALGEVTSSGWRLTHWMSMLDAIGREPWTGYGWSQVAHAQATVAPAHPRTGEIIDHSHNLVLDLLVWNGIPLGGVIVLALLAWAWVAAGKSSDSTSVLALAAVGVVIAHGLLEFPLEYAYFLLPVGLLMGLISATTADPWTCGVPRVSLWAGTVAAVALTAIVATDYLAIEEDWRQVRFEEARIGLHVPAPPPRKIRVLTQLETFLRVARMEPKAGMSQEELDAMRRVAERYPFSYPILKYATALALDGHPEAARAALQPICQTHPAGLCASARRHWVELGEKEPLIAAVPWP